MNLIALMSAMQRARVRACAANHMAGDVRALARGCAHNEQKSLRGFVSTLLVVMVKTGWCQLAEAG